MLLRGSLIASPCNCHATLHHKARHGACTPCNIYTDTNHKGRPASCMGDDALHTRRSNLSDNAYLTLQTYRRTSLKRRHHYHVRYEQRVALFISSKKYLYIIRYITQRARDSELPVDSWLVRSDGRCQLTTENHSCQFRRPHSHHMFSLAKVT